MLPQKILERRAHALFCPRPGAAMGIIPRTQVRRVRVCHGEQEGDLAQPLNLPGAGVPAKAAIYARVHCGYAGHQRRDAYANILRRLWLAKLMPSDAHYPGRASVHKVGVRTVVALTARGRRLVVVQEQQVRAGRRSNLLVCTRLGGSRESGERNSSIRSRSSEGSCIFILGSCSGPAGRRCRPQGGGHWCCCRGTPPS